MPSAANTKRANTTKVTVHLDMGTDRVGGDTSDSERVAPVTMPSPANTKRPDTTKPGGDTLAEVMGNEVMKDRDRDRISASIGPAGVRASPTTRGTSPR